METTNMNKTLESILVEISDAQKKTDAFLNTEKASISDYIRSLSSVFKVLKEKKSEADSWRSSLAVVGVMAEDIKKIINGEIPALVAQKKSLLDEQTLLRQANDEKRRKVKELEESLTIKQSFHDVTLKEMNLKFIRLNEQVRVLGEEKKMLSQQCKEKKDLLNSLRKEIASEKVAK